MATQQEAVSITGRDQQQLRLDEKLRRELGESVLAALADHLTEDICLNPGGKLWANRQGDGWKQIGELSVTQAYAAMGTIATQRGTVVNYDRPILETELPIDGSRFEGLVPPVVPKPAFAIRLRPRRIFTLEEYARSEILTGLEDPRNRARRSENFAAVLKGLTHVEILEQAIAERKNLLIVGSTGSGKTTLVNACLGSIASTHPSDRVITIEDTMELRCPVENYVDLRAFASVSMLDCLRACMRLKPKRIIVGEVRGAEAHVMLKAWNTGHPGGVAIVAACVLFGIVTRSDREFKLGFHPDEARNVTAATDVGKAIASKIPARPAESLEPTVKAEKGADELAVPPFRYEPARTTPVMVHPAYDHTVVQYVPTPPQPPQLSAEDRRKELALQREQEAMDAPTTARDGYSRDNAGGVNSSATPTAQGEGGQINQLLQALQGTAVKPGVATPRSVSLTGQPPSAAEEYKIQNSQDEKEEFFDKAKSRDQETYLGKMRARPLGKFEIKAGWDIPAVLEQALNSDLPGDIKALIRENVYDTATGKYLLIPQGSRLVGNYLSRISYGQNGIQVVWDRIIFPDGSSLVLDGMSGEDAKGAAGLRDQVDNHYGRLFSMGALTSLFAAAGQLTVNRRSNVFSYPSPQELAGQSVAQNMSQIGAEATRRNLNVQPTIKVAVGYRFNVRVNRDILFEEPYRPYRP